jgi:3-hydroxyisobutyrate dehydrogenase-like beta-hydroxyacid dehydrogenase
MTRRLSGAGLDVTVWNRSFDTAESLANEISARTARSPAALAERCDVILTSLADDQAVEDVYLGVDGVVAGIGPGKVAVDTSTVDPSTVHTVGAGVDRTGAGFLDCPVSGSVATIEAGSLTIMAGGDAGLLESVLPVLEPLSSRVIHVGARGSGAATKLAVNGLVHGLNVALAEALVLAEKAGIDRSVAYEVFASGAAGAPFVQYKRASFERPEETPVGFSLDLMRKDLELITGLGSEVGVEMRQAGIGLEIVEDAISSGLGDADMSAIATYLRSKGA